MNMPRYLFVVSCIACCSGCYTIDDLLSMSPLWRINASAKQVVPRKTWDNSTAVSTVNYFDSANGRPVRYSYRIDSGFVKYRTDHFPDTTAWSGIPGGNPIDCEGNMLSVLRLAADNNRVFVLAENRAHKRSLWWYCIKPDSAKWSVDLVNALGDFMHEGYRNWTKCAHGDTAAGKSWINLMSLRSFVFYREPKYIVLPADSNGQKKVEIYGDRVPRLSLNVDDVVDIAVGNWKGTVVTFYIILGSTGKILYIDEEVIMDRWQVVPHAVQKVQSPYPLDSTASIAASNSVICAYKPVLNKDGSYRSSIVSWIRWDFHNPQDFHDVLNWCQDNWVIDTVNIPGVRRISLNTHWNSGDLRDTVWGIPRALGWGSRSGLMGSMVPELVKAYPVSITFHRNQKPDTTLVYQPTDGSWIKVASLTATTVAGPTVKEKAVFLQGFFRWVEGVLIAIFNEIGGSGSAVNKKK